MPRGDQVTRLYALVMELAGARRGLTAATLATRRGLATRMVYRDLHALEDAGFPVTRGDGARWLLVDGWEARVPFPLPARELLALQVARAVMKPLAGTPVARELDAVVERLGGAAPSTGRQGELFPRLRARIATRSQLAIDYTAHTALLETLCRASEARQTVNVAYYTESRRELTRRALDPYTLYYDPQLEALYVFGWCHLRAAMRTFAVPPLPPGAAHRAFVRGAGELHPRKPPRRRVPHVAGRQRRDRVHPRRRRGRRLGGRAPLAREPARRAPPRR